jgi:iron complex outermembrane recepter protein
MKTIVLIFLVSILSVPLMAATGIKGTIVDAGDQSPLDFVNIALFKPGSKTPITGVSTDNNGVFNIPKVENGKYNLRISYVGYSTVNQVLEITGKPLNLGVIKLDEDSKKLKEVEVVAQGSQMHFDIDKKVFSVDKNISAAGGSASDVLKNIPSVTVDNEGNVSLRKDGNVEVWINGKASGLTADNRAQVLQQMPAESIESVEIMTNPSAKFNPEGSAGIINIVMKKNRKAGYYGSVSGGLTYPDGGKLGKNVGASINYSSTKLDAYVNLGYRAMSFKGAGTTNRTNFDAKDSTLLNQNYSMLNSFSGLFMRAGIDYHLDTKNTLSLSGFGMAGSGNSETNTNYLLTNQLTDPASVLRNYSRNNAGTGTRPSLNMNLDYRHEFDKKGTSLNASLSYSHHNRTSDNTYVMNDVLASSNNSNISQNTDGENKELELKVDYTNKQQVGSRLAKQCKQ